MRVLVVGAGAIGGYYGARLLEAGAHVTFLVRKKRAEQLSQTGLQVLSQLGDFNSPVSTVQRDALKPDYDLVIIGCKTYDLESVLSDVGGAIDDQTVVLPFLNGISVYERLDQVFGRERVAGGVAYIATTLGTDGVIRHAGVSDILQVGPRTASQNETIQRFHQFIAKSKGVRAVPDDIEQALWNKWVMLASGAAMTCLMRGTVGEIMATNAGRGLMSQAIEECMALAFAAGRQPTDEDIGKIRALLLDPNSSWCASMMRDIAANANRLEAHGIVGDLLDRATTHGIDLPLIRIAYCNLQVYQQRQT